MKKTKFTDQFLAGLKVPVGCRFVEISDAMCSGLYFRVSAARGTRTFYFRYHRPKALGGNTARIALGSYPKLTLKDARRKADSERDKIESGIDPHTAKEESRPGEIEGAAGLTFGAMVDAYIQFKSTPGHGFIKSWAEVGRSLQVAKDRWGPRPAISITKTVAAKLTAEIAKAAPSQANHLHTYLQGLFNWAIQPAQNFMETNPLHGLKKPAKSKKKDRALEDDEIVQVWGMLDQPWKLETQLHITLALKLILVTMCRPGMATGMKKEELRNLDGDDPQWHVPADRMKNGKPFIIPLNKMAVEIIEEALIKNDTPFVFPSHKRTKKGQPIVKPLARHSLSQVVARGRGKHKSLIQMLGIKPFTPHDLRRTASTFSRKHGARRDAVEALLSHTPQDVTAVYDRYDMLAEKREVATLLGAALIRLLKPSITNKPNMAKPVKLSKPVRQRALKRAA